MIYRYLGRTGKKISAIGFGGMRFKSIDDKRACRATLEKALALGINYFDTAPGYFGVKSEQRFGEVLHDKAVLISTKSMASKGTELRRDLDASLKRLNRSKIDIFHIWYVLTKEDYARRRKGGAIDAALRAKAEGLIGELFISTHMNGAEIQGVLEEGVFSGVTLGLSVINVPYRLAALETAARMGLGVVCMNPLAGGLIPRNPKYFSFLKGPSDRNVTEAALRYLLSVDGVSTALVGFGEAREVDAAVKAVEPFIPWSPLRIETAQARLTKALDRICTGCNYCKGCPVDIPIPKLMLAYNQKVLGDDTALRTSLQQEWGVPPAAAAACTACGGCEAKCTQKLPIIERLKYIAQLK